ncbi:hypothetical protein KLP28_07910 [Nocardioidaceae bacterium]|nr:hypothetical protein KLP28_07910 [Nocardioidaceae bacterium]
MTESYGPYQEFAALALQHLVTQRSTLQPESITPVLQARNQIILTLRDRAALLGARRRVDLEPRS